MTHKDWLDKEYEQWIKALRESTVDNFGSHPMVKRMLGEPEGWELIDTLQNFYFGETKGALIGAIESIGGEIANGRFARFIYYAKEVLKSNPSHICEIGGGVGQFYAVLRGLGYQGKYFIFDLPEVKEFQRKYLDEVTKRTGLNTDLEYGDFDFCYSAYCLGELDDETKYWYVENVVRKTPHGLIIWNPHSGASGKINFDGVVTDEYPLTSPGNKQIVW